MQIGIFLPNWIGDTVMATPALRALRQHFGPTSVVIGVMRPHLAEVLAGKDWFDEVVFFDPRSRQPSQRGWPVVRRLRQQSLDVAVLLSNSFRTGLMAWASGARRRVGYGRHGRGLLLNLPLDEPRRGWRRIPTPAIDSYLRLTSALGCPATSPQLELATLPADEAAADTVWRKLGLGRSGAVAVLNSGGAFGAAKHWPAEHFGALARRLAERDGLQVLVNCGPSERQIAEQITRIANHAGVVSLAAEENLPIGLTKACIRRSRLLVSTDSGPRFFGVAFGVPVVSLFGPTHIEWSRTQAGGEICLQQPVPCGPCMQRTCPLEHHQCMRELSVERVYRAVQAALAEGPSSASAAGLSDDKAQAGIIGGAIHTACILDAPAAAAGMPTINERE